MELKFTLMKGLRMRKPSIPFACVLVDPSNTEDGGQQSSITINREGVIRYRDQTGQQNIERAHQRTDMGPFHPLIIKLDVKKTSL